MKKFGILILFIVGTCPLFAQQYFGVRGGYAISGVNFNPYRQETTISGVDFGLACKLYTGRYMGMQAELNMVQKGYEARDTTYAASAIELPAMAQGHLKFGAFRAFINAGFYMSYLLKEDTKYENSSGISVTESYTFQDRDNRFEYGVIGGGGLGLEFSRFELQGEFRYQYGMNFWIKPRYQDEQTVFSNSTHMVFSLSLFYRIGSAKQPAPISQN